MTGERRDCACPQARHQHGTYLAYNADRCRCLPCRNAKHANQQRIRLAAARARWNGGAVLVPIVGPQRRLQSLAAIGWSLARLGERLGVTARAVSFVRDGEYKRVHPDLAARIAALYDELWDEWPAGQGPLLARRHAAGQGWAPPLAWDDDDGPHGIDNPDATPALPENGPRELDPCGTLGAYRRHYRRGEPACRDCHRAHQEAKRRRRAA